MNRRISQTEKAPVRRELPRVFRKRRTADKPAPDASPKVVRPIYRLSFPMLLLICLSIAVAAGGFLYHLHVRFEGVRLGYEASQARKAQTQLMLDRRELRLELASMKEPGRIEDEAREKLGMETPEFDRIIPVNKKRRVVSVSGGAL